MALIKKPGKCYLAKIRQTLRLTSTAFDAELCDLIQECRADLVQLGVRQDLAENEKDPLVLGAVRTFVCWRFSQDDKLATRSQENYQQLRNELRRRAAYTEEVET